MDSRTVAVVGIEVVAEIEVVVGVEEVAPLLLCWQ